MVHIKFEYQDKWTNGEWRQQECICTNIAECVKLYGLKECPYRILSVKEIEK